MLQEDQQSPQSVYLNFHNKSSGKVDKAIINDNKAKVNYYHNRILDHKYKLGEDTDNIASVVQSDYTNYHTEIDKNYLNNTIIKEENKTKVEKQNINIFDGERVAIARNVLP